MYFADGFVKHVLFMAMVLWKQVHFYGDDLADGLVKQVYFMVMTLMVFWDMNIFLYDGLVKQQ